jgi:hypothetical protein
MATKCPVTRQQFLAGQPIKIIVPGVGEITMQPTESSKNSLGYYVHGRYTMDFGEVQADVILGINITLVNSNKLP